MKFDRVINLNVELADPPPAFTYHGDIDIKNLRISFSIVKSESWSTNTANIRVWNLSSDNRNRFNIYGDRIKLFAGYKSENSVQQTGAQLLFDGNSTLVSHNFSYPDIISEFQCGDGEKSLNNIIVSWSFGPNTPARTVIQAYANSLGLSLVEFSATDNLVYNHGHKYSGIAKNGLELACKYLNLIASVQNNNLVILQNGVGSAKPPVEINPQNGMIGTPERYTDKRQYLYRALPPNNAPKPGWKVKTLLRPDILPGDRVRIRSQQVDLDGIFYVITIRHDGDNYGNQFDSTLEVISV